MNEIVPVEDGAPTRRAPLMAGAKPMAIVPQSMEDAYRLAVAVTTAGMAPAGLETPEKAMVAILHGLEIGLTPMAALQRIAVVNGRPTIWGDGAMSLVRASGLCEYIDERLDGSGDNRIAICEAKRRGQTKPIQGKFSVDDAKRAGLWDTRDKVRRKNKGSGEWYEASNDAPWYRYPERMMQMRARAFCLRDGFADVLGGLYLKEELDDGGDADRSASAQRRAPPASAPASIEHRPDLPAERQPVSTSAPTEKPASARRAPSATPAAPAKQETPPAATQYDPEAIRKAFDKDAAAAKDRDALNEAWNTHVDPIWDGIPEGHPDRADLDRLYKLHAARVDGEEGAEP